MTSKWKTLSSETKYKNPWIEVIEDKVIMPNGKEGIYGYLKKLPGVFVIAEDSDDGIFFITEYRYVLKREILQLPSGTLESYDGNPVAMAKRELTEETGITAKNFELIGKYFVAPGHETTMQNTVLATGLDTSSIHTENQEGDESILSVHKFTVKEIKQMIKSGKIMSGLTLAALNQYLIHKNK